MHIRPGASDAHVVRATFMEGSFAAIHRHAKSASTILDGGANVGAPHSLLLPHVRAQRPEPQSQGMKDLGCMLYAACWTLFAGCAILAVAVCCVLPELGALWQGCGRRECGDGWFW